MKLGFTGTRHGMSQRQWEAFELLLCELDGKHGVTEFHHGDCVGADKDAHLSVARTLLNCDIVIHPPEDPKLRAWMISETILRPLPYLERNRAIVNAVDLLVAAPFTNHEEVRSGTWATIRYAKKVGREVHTLRR